jgi:hypothetical protein
MFHVAIEQEEEAWFVADERKRNHRRMAMRDGTK